MRNLMKMVSVKKAIDRLSPRIRRDLRCGAQYRRSCMAVELQGEIASHGLAIVELRSAQNDLHFRQYGFVVDDI